MTAVTLQDITKRFPISGSDSEVVALDNISLHIPSKQRVAILGPSGCGKTTLLRIIAGLESPDSGRILFDRQELKDIDLMDRGIGMVFQDYALVPHWEAKKSVGFFLHLRKREYEIPDRIVEISRVTGIGLDKIMDRRPSQLSGGEKQRIAIARAFARDLRVLLFDEPFASLDAKLRERARLELNRLLSKYPITSIFVTHDQVEATSLAHQIVVMRKGKIEQIGTFLDLYNEPRSLFVAGFIGAATMNMFSGSTRDGMWYGKKFGGFPIQINRGNLPEQVTMVVRGDHVLPTAEGDVSANISNVTPMYSERYNLIEAKMANEQIVFKMPMNEIVHIGDDIRLRIDPEFVQFFDSNTGVRIT